MNLLNKSDTALYFDAPTHKYTDSYQNEYVSCTTLLHKFVPAFDSKYWAKYKAKERGVSEKAIKAEWELITDISCERGNKTHDYLEGSIKEVSRFKEAVRYLEESGSNGRMFTVYDIDFNNNVGIIDMVEFYERVGKRYPEIYRVIEHYVNLGYRIYSEIGVFLQDHLVSGMIDILCIRESDFVILDWKTNKDGLRFTSGYYKKDKRQTPHQNTNEWVAKAESLNPPLRHLSNCNGNIYSLQLSMYATMVHIITGLPCRGLGLCHIGTQFILNQYAMPLRDEKGMYTVDDTKEEIVKWFRINFLYEECRTILAERKATIVAKVDTQGKLF